MATSTNAEELPVLIIAFDSYYCRALISTTVEFEGWQNSEIIQCPSHIDFEKILQTTGNSPSFVSGDTPQRKEEGGGFGFSSPLHSKMAMMDIEHGDFSTVHGLREAMLGGYVQGSPSGIFSVFNLLGNATITQEDGNGSILVHARVGNETQTFHWEECIAMIFRKLKYHAERKMNFSISFTKALLVLSARATFSQRKAFETAARIAGLVLLRTITPAEAVLTQEYIFGQNLVFPSPQEQKISQSSEDRALDVLYVKFGRSEIELARATFTQEGVIEEQWVDYCISTGTGTNFDPNPQNVGNLACILADHIIANTICNLTGRPHDAAVVAGCYLLNECDRMIKEFSMNGELSHGLISWPCTTKVEKEKSWFNFMPRTPPQTVNTINNFTSDDQGLQQIAVQIQDIFQQMNRFQNSGSSNYCFPSEKVKLQYHEDLMKILEKLDQRIDLQGTGRAERKKLVTEVISLQDILRFGRRKFQAENNGNPHHEFEIISRAQLSKIFSTHFKFIAEKIILGECVAKKQQKALEGNPLGLVILHGELCPCPGFAESVKECFQQEGQRRGQKIRFVLSGNHSGLVGAAILARTLSGWKATNEQQCQKRKRTKDGGEVACLYLATSGCYDIGIEEFHHPITILRPIVSVFTTVPTRGSYIVRTAIQNQPSFPFTLVEEKNDNNKRSVAGTADKTGETCHAPNTGRIGSFCVMNLPQTSAAGTEIEISVQFDANLQMDIQAIIYPHTPQLSQKLLVKKTSPDILLPEAEENLKLHLREFQRFPLNYDGLPQDVEGWKNRGNEAYKNQRFTEAVVCFTKGLDFISPSSSRMPPNPNWHILLSNRSGSYFSMQQYVQAVVDAESCTKVSPTWPKGYTRLGAALWELKEYNGAINAYSRAFELDPSSPTAKEALEKLYLLRDGVKK